MSTVADKMKQAGYKTLAVGKWHAGGHSSQHLPLNRGFDEFLGFLNGHTSHFTHYCNTIDCVDMMDGDKPSWKYFGQYGDEAFYNRTFDFISRQAKNKNRDPFFIYHSFREDFKPSPVLLSFVAVLFVLSIFQTL
eukprot:m.174940 g.174940  ORF g.174940 m.174940 type:complete len:135 (-) comp13510_c0_seq23:2744-3148(-)